MPYLFIPEKNATILIHKIKLLAADYYNKILALEKGSKIYSFAISADSDITTFAFHYNTTEGIKQIIEDSIQARKESPEENNYPLDDDKWSVYEWASETDASYNLQHGTGYDEVQALMDQLYKQSSWDLDDSKNTFADYKRDMFDIFCDALTEMVEANVFQQVSEEFFLLFQEGDNGIYDGRVKSLEKILSPSQLKDYVAYLDF